MKLQSGESVTIDILGSAEKLVWDVITQALWLLAFVALFVTAAPVLVFFLLGTSALAAATRLFP